MFNLVDFRLYKISSDKSIHMFKKKIGNSSICEIVFDNFKPHDEWQTSQRQLN